MQHPAAGNGDGLYGRIDEIAALNTGLLAIDRHNGFAFLGVVGIGLKRCLTAGTPLSNRHNVTTLM